MCLSLPGGFFHKVWVGQMFKFVKLILFLKMYLGNGQSPFSQTVGSLLIPPGRQSQLENDLSLAPIDLTNSKIWLTPALLTNIKFHQNHFLKTYLRGGQTPYSQTVVSLLIPPGWQSRLGKWSKHSSNIFDKLKNLTNSFLTYKQPFIPFWIMCLSLPGSVFNRVWVGQIFKFIKLLLFLKTYLRGGQAPCSQKVESLLISPWLAKPTGKMIWA